MCQRAKPCLPPLTLSKSAPKRGGSAGSHLPTLVPHLLVGHGSRCVFGVERPVSERDAGFVGKGGAEAVQSGVLQRTRIGRGEYEHLRELYQVDFYSAGYAWMRGIKVYLVQYEY